MVQRGPAGGLLAQVVVLVVLATTVGLGPLGWAAGLACGAVTYALPRRRPGRHDRGRLGPADRVTLARAVLVGGVAGPGASTRQPRRARCWWRWRRSALLLDRVDGEVARRTGTVSGFGAAFDMEVDAFLILVLSVYVARRRRAVGAADRARRATRCGSRHGCCPGCARACRRGRGPRSSPRCRASC